MKLHIIHNIMEKELIQIDYCTIFFEILHVHKQVNN